MLIDFFFDKETYSECDLPDNGTVKYATHPSTEVTLVTWCFGRTGPVKSWRPGQEIPKDLMDVINNPERYKFIAWNIQFDFMIWTQIMRRLFPAYFVAPKIHNLEDAMAISVHNRTGASLEACAKFHNLGYNKDKEGRVLMLKSCKPRAGKRVYLTDEEWVHFERYGMMDTRILRDCYYRMPALPPSERWAWEWTFKRNLRGIKLDVPLIQEMDSIIKEAVPKLVAEFNHCVNYKATLNSPVKCKEFFKQYYPHIEDMTAETMRGLMADTREVPPQVRRALEIKDLAGSTSISKITAALSRMHDGRIYEVLAYGYTQTKRWAGRGIQVQNFPRPDDTLSDPLDFDMNTKDLVTIVKDRRPHLVDPVGFCKNLLRRMFLPNDGEQFYCGDFSKVEPSVLFWLCDMGPIPKKWYEEMAAEIYSLPLDQISKDGIERQVGKAASLSCGYGTGWKGFQESQQTAGLVLSDDMCKQVIHAYRRKNEKIVQFWKQLEYGFRRAIHGEASKLCNGRVIIMPMQHPWKGVQIRLPSGGHLYYHQAKEDIEYYNEEIVEIYYGTPRTITIPKTRAVLKYLADKGNGRVDWEYTYSGKLCENVVSATAREILVPAMWRLENAGFDVLNVVHDEIWASAQAGRDEEFNKVMCMNPSWCDMQIGSDLKVGLRYLK